MKLGPVTKLDKRNKKHHTKKIDNDTMPEICDAIVVFPEQSGCIVCKTYIFINSNLFYLTKTENKTKKSLTKL